MAYSLDSQDWQKSKPEQWQQNEYIFENSLWTDCEFIVGKDPDVQVIKCHKLLLSKASSVFAAMLNGPLAEKGSITIPDIEPQIFKLLVTFMYTSKQPKIDNFDLAMHLCYAAKKYMLQQIVDLCVEYLWNDITPSNVCQGYEFAKLMEVSKIAAKCIKVMQEETDEILKCKGFIDIENSTLVAILMQDQLNVNSEEELINAAISWATAEAKKKNLSLNHKTLRQVLGPAFEHLRFLNFSLLEFAKGPMQSNLLCNEEKIAIMSCIESQSTTVLDQFQVCKIKAKRNLLHKSICTFQTENITNVTHNGMDCSLEFLFHKNVYISSMEINMQQINLIHDTLLYKQNYDGDLFPAHFMQNWNIKNTNYQLSISQTVYAPNVIPSIQTNGMTFNLNILLKFNNISIDAHTSYKFQLHITKKKANLYNGLLASLFFIAYS